MTNLSQQRREEMLAYLDKLRDLHGDDESLRLINQIQNEINNKRYGLIWEEHSEHVDEMLVDNIPVFVDVPEKTITCDKSKKYNFLLEGDNLHSLNLLRKTHLGKVDVIYIDPPYNTRSSKFIYDDTYVDGNDTFNHSKWCSMIDKRLRIAKDLLAPHGLIFISIDDNEFANLRHICNNIFGENMFVGTIAWEKRTKSQNTSTAKYMLQPKVEYILVYKNQTERVDFCLFDVEERKYPEIDENGNPYRLERIGEMSKFGMRGRETMIFPILGIMPNEGNQWKYGQASIQEFINRGDIVIKDAKPWLRIRPEDETSKQAPFWGLKTKEVGTAETGKSELNAILKTVEHGFETVKPVRLIYELLYHAVAQRPEAVILDFFAGSGTTGQAVQQLNKDFGGERTYILCTNNENGICENITYKRLANIQDELPHNLRYYRTDFVAKFNPEDEDHSVTDATLENIRELIELEHQTYIDGINNALLLDNDEIQYVLMNVADGANVYASSWIFFGAEDFQLIEEKGLNVITIPNYYFEGELIEVGEC